MRIPLFPLRTVLFPGMVLPLRIFEERYKQMVRELLASDGRFGVLLIREGEEVGGSATPHDVGVVAHIEQWTELEQGRFTLAARGTDRFRLLTMLPPQPYPFGEIALIENDAPETSDQLSRALETVRTTFPLYFRLALALTDQWARGMRLPDAPHALVDFVGPWIQAPETTKQRLIEIEPAAQRVAELASILDELLTHTRREVAEYHRAKYLGIGPRN